MHAQYIEEGVDADNEDDNTCIYIEIYEAWKIVIIKV